MDFPRHRQLEQPPQSTLPTRLWGLGIFLLAILIGVALLTYQRGEMGWEVFNPVDAVKAAEVPCTNWLGIPGLYVAGFIYWLLGAASVYTMILLSILGLCILILPSRPFAGQVVATICLVMCACAILSVQPLFLVEWAAEKGISSVGGTLGYLDGCCLTEPLMGRKWTLIFYICGHAVALIYFARMNLLQFLRGIWKDFRSIVEAIRSHRERRRERLQELQKSWHKTHEEAQEAKKNPIFRVTEEEEPSEEDSDSFAEQQPVKPLRTSPEPTPVPAATPTQRPRQLTARQRALREAEAARAAEEAERREARRQTQQTDLPPRRQSAIARTPAPTSRYNPAQPEQATPPSTPTQPEPTPTPMQTTQALQEATRPERKLEVRTQRPARTTSQEERRNNLLDLMEQVEQKISLSTAPGASEEDERKAIELNQPKSRLSGLFNRGKSAAKPAPKPEQRPAPRGNVGKGDFVDPRPQEADYPLPPYELLDYKPVPSEVTEAARVEMMDMQQRIIDTLDTFKINVTAGEITRGPSITRYEFFLPRGMRVSRVAKLDKELMLSTMSKSVNILAPIPGKDTVGIELENAQKSPVYLRELLQSKAFNNPKLRIPVALGKDVYGNAVVGDLAAMPHTLVAGTTGSGKSVCINSMILSMLYKFRPDELKLILVDPKMVEMQPYRKLPHLACPVVTVAARVIGALRWAVNEMEHRYKLFSQVGVRNFEDFNNREPDEVREPEEDEYEDDYVDFDAIDRMESEILRQADEERELTDEDQDEFDFGEEENVPTRLPYVVIIIDELADLMVMVKDDLENNIARLTQKARAAGIHLVAATQTPRANVVTGLIKANIPSRIAFRVASPLDSRIILDTTGAENLLGAGDCLFLPPGGITKMSRVQGAWVSDREIADIIQHCASHAKQKFESGVTAEMNNSEGGGDGGGRIGTKNMSDEESELYTRCVNMVVTERKASTSLLQRRFSIGYSKAAKIMDIMEENGIIGPSQGSARAREVLIDPP